MSAGGQNWQPAWDARAGLERNRLFLTILSNPVVQVIRSRHYRDGKEQWRIIDLPAVL